MMEQTVYLLSTGTLPEELTKGPGSGFVLDVVPFIEIENIEIEIPVTEVAVFTSANAVNALRQIVSHVAPEWRIYCIGGATFEAVSEVFGEKSVVGTAESASRLATLIVRQEAGPREKIVFFCGDQRREELPSLGFTEKVVYRTVLTPQQLGQRYDGISFFSPSAVESYFSVNRIGEDIPLFAIGPTTAAAIHSRCRNPVIVGERPDKTLLIRQMTDYFLNK